MNAHVYSVRFMRILR